MALGTKQVKHCLRAGIGSIEECMAYTGQYSFVLALANVEAWPTALVQMFTKRSNRGSLAARKPGSRSNHEVLFPKQRKVVQKLPD